MAKNVSDDPWPKLRSAWKNGETISATVISANSHRLIVDVGVRALLPKRLIDADPSKAPNQYLGQQLPVKIIELHQPTENVVVSHRAARKTH